MGEMMSVNQIGRELTRRLVEKHNCDLQVAIRFFYNSNLYRELEASSGDVSLSMDDIDALFERFEREFSLGM